jgi:hypothetical protein
MSCPPAEIWILGIGPTDAEMDDAVDDEMHFIATRPITADVQLPAASSGSETSPHAQQFRGLLSTSAENKLACFGHSVAQQ